MITDGLRQASLCEARASTSILADCLTTLMVTLAASSWLAVTLSNMVCGCFIDGQVYLLLCLW